DLVRLQDVLKVPGPKSKVPDPSTLVLDFGPGTLDLDSSQHAAGCAAPIGLDDRDFSPFMIEVGSDSPTFLVAGPAHSGKSTLLSSIILSLASRYPPDRVRFAVAG